MNFDNISIEKMLNNNDSVQNQIDDIIFNLIKERKRNKISQIELSKIAGIPQVTISRLESFNSTPTLQNLIKIANALGMSLTLIKENFNEI